MSNGIKLDGRLYRFGTMCVRCGGCTYGYEEAGFKEVCPIYKRYQFFTYSLGGMLQLARALCEGRLQLTESVSGVIYSCTSCGACGEMCAEVDFPDIVQLQHELRARCVEAGQIPYAHMAVIEGLKEGGQHVAEAQGRKGQVGRGPGGEGCHQGEGRGLLPRGLQVLLQRGSVACGQSAVTLLKAAGVDVGIAGANETCCGGRAYEMGYQGEFLKYAENNVEMLKTAGVKTVVTSCADGYYTFKVLYDMAGKAEGIEVFHITEYLSRLIRGGRLKPKAKVPMKVTFHDPCHLGRKTEPWLFKDGKVRAGELYQFPRDILAAIPGLELVEMERNRASAWCCGAGGGVIDADPEFALWIARERLQEAKATGAEAIVTACPWCKRTFNDALKEGDIDLEVYDVVELLKKAL